MHSVFPGPSGAPEFLADKISTSSTSLSVVWRPPPASTLNGEFLGYEMTYRTATAAAGGAAAVSDNDIGVGGTGSAKKIAINEDMLRIQVGDKGEVRGSQRRRARQPFERLLL